MVVVAFVVSPVVIAMLIAVWLPLLIAVWLPLMIVVRLALLIVVRLALLRCAFYRLNIVVLCRLLTVFGPFVLVAVVLVLLFLGLIKAADVATSKQILRTFDASCFVVFKQR